MLVFSSSDFFEVYLGVDQKKVSKSSARGNCNILCNFNNSLSAKIKVQSFTDELLCAPLGKKLQKKFFCGTKNSNLFFVFTDLIFNTVSTMILKVFTKMIQRQLPIVHQLSNPNTKIKSQIRLSC